VSTPRFVVVGEALVDVVAPREGRPAHAPGGSPLNVAVGLARLGIDTVLMTELGDDAYGDVVLDHLTASGVALHEGSVVPTSTTSTATATLDEHGAAAYSFDLRWNLGPRTLPADVSGLHVGSLGAALRPGRASVLGLVDQAVERGLLVTFDPNARPVLAPDAESAWRDVRELAEAADLVKLSDEDVAFLRPGAPPTDVARSLLTGRARLVVVTAGGTDALAVSVEGQVSVRSRATDVVDTVGAGDSFMAALVAVALEHGLDDLHGDRVAGYLHAAHAAAAITVSRRGADPPRREELPRAWPARG
jgi:fructokinase